MRTTLNLDDDLLRAIRSLARERDETLSAVASDLIRAGLRPSGRIGYEGDFPVFQVREGTPPLTPDMVDEALEES